MKNLPANAVKGGAVGLILGWKDSLEEELATCSSHGQSLVGYSPCGGKESDTTEQLSTPTAPGNLQNLQHRRYFINDQQNS